LVKLASDRNSQTSAATLAAISFALSTDPRIALVAQAPMTYLYALPGLFAICTVV
jgi:hypothetical protein